MKKGILKLVFVIVGFITINSAAAQIADTVASQCAKNLENIFISDGQQYRALLMNADETAEFRTTLYGGTVYRLLKDGPNITYNEKRY